MAKRNWEAQMLEAAEAVLVGKRITKVRYMTQKEAAEEGWMHRPLVICFDDGTQLYASRDAEGNDAGVMFGQLGTNDSLLRFPSM